LHGRRVFFCFTVSKAGHFPLGGTRFRKYQSQPNIKIQTIKRENMKTFFNRAFTYVTVFVPVFSQTQPVADQQMTRRPPTAW
jgi:hypothetical protein